MISTLTDNAADLDIVMPINNLLEYSQKYSDIRKFMDSDGKSFKYKTKIVGNTLERPESTASTNFTC